MNSCCSKMESQLMYSTKCSPDLSPCDIFLSSSSAEFTNQSWLLSLPIRLYFMLFLKRSVCLTRFSQDICRLPGPPFSFDFTLHNPLQQLVLIISEYVPQICCLSHFNDDQKFAVPSHSMQHHFVRIMYDMSMVFLKVS